MKQIYYEKCAFCESELKNDFGEIEHYRPKNRSETEAKNCDKRNSYYWLAFSWDNLLPACKRCNGKKSNCFDIEGEYKEYQGENLENLHLVTQEYNEVEKPKLLHPEYDRFENHIVFNLKDEMSSDNERVNYTIQVCDLNRENLVDSREKIVTDFISQLQRHLLSFDKVFNGDNLQECLEYFKVTIEDFYAKSGVESQYSLIRKYIKNNLIEFLESVEIGYEDKEFAITIIASAFNEFCLEDN